MNWVDFVILGIIGLSALISLVRGFVREAISIATWIAAFVLARMLAGPLSQHLAAYIESPTLQFGAAFAAIFVTVLLTGALLNYLASLFVDKTGLSGTDRTLGVVFGAGRGLLVVVFLLLLAGLTSVPREVWWRESVLVTGLTPWVCRFGVNDWMREWTVRVPIANAGLAPSAGTPLGEYWTEFCTQAPAGADPQ